MKLKLSCTLLALSAILTISTSVRADYLAPETGQPATAPTGSTSVGSVSSSSALTTQNSSDSSPAVMVDNHDAGWTWNNMVEYTDPYLYQKSGYAGGPGSYGVYTFHGTGVEITGMAGPSVRLDGVSHTMGAIEVYIDGKQIALNSLHLQQTKYRDSIFKIDGLDSANHVLHIEPSGGWIVVNYITILNTPPAVATAQSVEVSTDTSNDGPGYRLIPENGVNLCLDVAPGPLKGAKVDIWETDSTRTQIWSLNAIGNGKYTLSPIGHSDLVLWIVPSSPNNEYTQAFLWPNTGAPNEILTVTPGRTFSSIQCQVDSTAMDVPPIPFADGDPVVGAVMWARGCQMWSIEKVNN